MNTTALNTATPGTAACAGRLDTVLATESRPLPLLRRIIPALRQGVRKLLLDERERYLSGAADHVDLYQRMRAWDDCDQRKHRFTHLP